MKIRLLLTALCLIAAPASHVWAQTAAPETAAPETVRPTITTTGQVNKPGKFPFVEGEKLSALLERAGGATAIASTKELYVLRDGVVIRIDLSGSQTGKFVLREGDTLVVPQDLRQIFVMGNVVRPGYYPMKEKKPTFVWEALMLAGGPSANSANIYVGIIRREPKLSDDWYDWPTDINAPLFQIPLQEGDGIYVTNHKPVSGLQLLHDFITTDKI